MAASGLTRASRNTSVSDATIEVSVPDGFDSRNESTDLALSESS